MIERPATLDYSPHARRRVAPSRNDWSMALFIVLAVIAGLIGLAGMAGFFLLWVNPSSLQSPGRPSAWTCALCLVGYASFLTLALMAARFARRRTRPAG
jgi:hypothetical protein